MSNSDFIDVTPRLGSNEAPSTSIFKSSPDPDVHKILKKDKKTNLFDIKHEKTLDEANTQTSNMNMWVIGLLIIMIIVLLFMVFLYFNRTNQPPTISKNIVAPPFITGRKEVNPTEEELDSILDNISKVKASRKKNITTKKVTFSDEVVDQNQGSKLQHVETSPDDMQHEEINTEMIEKFYEEIKEGDDEEYISGNKSDEDENEEYDANFDENEDEEDGDEDNTSEYQTPMIESDNE